MLDHYIVTNRTQDCKRLNIFCENCFSQNKNRFHFVCFNNLCARGLFQEILVSSTIPGHSYIPIDRAFASIENKLKVAKVSHPKDWIVIIESARMRKPFQSDLNFPFFLLLTCGLFLM